MKRFILIAALLGLMAGCQQPTLSQSKVEAQQRWSHTRATMLYGVGVEQLKVGQLDRAGAKAMEALALDANYTDAKILLAKVWIEQGSYRNAIEQLTAVCEEKPKAAEPLYLLAVAQEKDGQLKEALANYRKSHALETSNLAPVAAATEVMIQLNQPRQAREYIESYISQAGEDMTMYELAGRLAMGEQDYARAVRYYQQAHDLDTGNYRYREALAEALLGNGRPQDAADVLGDLVNEKDYTASARVLCLLGDSHLAAKSPRDARDAYRRATELQPRNAGTWTQLAKAALAMKDYDRCVVAARTALEVDAADVPANYVLGYALLLQGQNGQALAAMKAADAANPDNAVVLCLLGRAYAATGDSKQARECYRKALELEGDNVVAQELLAKVQSPNGKPHE